MYFLNLNIPNLGTKIKLKIGNVTFLPPKTLIPKMDV